MKAVFLVIICKTCGNTVKDECMFVCIFAVKNEKTSRVHASSRKHTKKCAMKMKQRKKERKKKETRKNDVCIKILLMEGGHL